MMPAPSCPVCHSPLPQGSPPGHCPRCLIAHTLTAETKANNAAWTTLAGIELYEEIGRGGMGVVYRARQLKLDRLVAVKMLLRAQFASVEDRARFHREALAAARLKHPGIVGIFDVGEDDGVPWFSMEHIAGQSLEQLVREHPMAATQAARFVQRVAEAVQHAHDNGVLHRDLKPSNILLDEDSTPRVTDFGIARMMTSSTTTNRRAAELTRTGQSLGSPGYAAPEQVLHGRADARTDVYGLGALLYHLLTGRPPFQGPTLDAILVQLRESDPLPPSKLIPGVPRDLETICLKCLSKQPEARYDTARAVADDLTSFLDHKPIKARPLGAAGHALRWCKRRPVVAALLAAVAALIVLMVAGSLRFAKKESDLEHRSTLLAEARSQRSAGIAWSRTHALESLTKAWKLHPSAELRNEVICCLALPEMLPLDERPFDESKLKIPDPTQSADGRCIAVIENNAAIIKERASGKVIARLPGHAAGALMKLNDDATRIAIAARNNNDLHVFEVSTAKKLFTCAHSEPVHSVDWSRDLIAVGCENRFITIWTDKGKLIHQLSGHESAKIVVRFKPHSQELMSISGDAFVRLWHAARGVELLHEETPANNTTPAWWSADGSTYFCARENHEQLLSFALDWPHSLTMLAPPGDEPHPENITTMDVNPDGTLVSTSDAGVCRVWDFAARTLVATIPKAEKEWNITRFSPDGATLWISGWDNGCTARSIKREVSGHVVIGPPSAPLFGSGNLLQNISRDGSMMVMSNNNDGCFIVGWPATKKHIMLKQPDVLSADFSPDGKLIVTTTYAANKAKVWSLPEGKLIRELDAPSVVAMPHFSPDGHTLLLRCGGGNVIYDTTTWQRARTFEPEHNLDGAAWSTDGKLHARYARQDIHLLDAITNKPIARLTIPASAGWLGNLQLAFNADSTVLIVHTAVGTVLRWDLSELRKELRERGMDW